MRLTIEYTAQLRRAAGVSSETLDASPDCTLADLVRSLIDRHGEELRRLLVDSQGRVQRSVLVFLGDEQVAAECSLPMPDGATITFAAPISGG